jgi:hypothetical protein
MAPAGSSVVELDRPETVAAAIAGVDLVVDPVPHPELAAERVVLREGGALIDVSMRQAAAGRRLRAETRAPRGTVVLNAGRTPGVSNLVVADLLGRTPRTEENEGVAAPTGLSRQPDHSERSAELLHHFKAPNFYTTSMDLIAPNRPSNVRLGPQGRSCVRSAVGVIGARPGAANRVPAGVHARGSVRAGRSSSPRLVGLCHRRPLAGQVRMLPECLGAQGPKRVRPPCSECLPLRN